LTEHDDTIKPLFTGAPSLGLALGLHLLQPALVSIISTYQGSGCQLNAKRTSTPKYLVHLGYLRSSAAYINLNTISCDLQSNKYGTHCREKNQLNSTMSTVVNHSVGREPAYLPFDWEVVTAKLSCQPPLTFPKNRSNASRASVGFIYWKSSENDTKYTVKKVNCT